MAGNAAPCERRASAPGHGPTGAVACRGAAPGQCGGVRQPHRGRQRCGERGRQHGRVARRAAHPARREWLGPDNGSDRRVRDDAPPAEHHPGRLRSRSPELPVAREQLRERTGPRAADHQPQCAPRPCGRITRRRRRQCVGGLDPCFHPAQCGEGVLWRRARRRACRHAGSRIPRGRRSRPPGRGHGRVRHGHAFRCTACAGEGRPDRDAARIRER